MLPRNEDVQLDVFKNVIIGISDSKDEVSPSTLSLNTLPSEMEFKSSQTRTPLHPCERVGHLVHSVVAGAGSAISGNLTWLVSKSAVKLLQDENSTMNHVGILVLGIAIGLGTITALTGATSLHHLKNAFGIKFFCRRSYQAVSTQEPTVGALSIPRRRESI